MNITKRVRRALVIPLLAVGLLIGVLGSPASATPASQPPNSHVASCLYTWADMGSYLYTGGVSYGSANCTTDITVFCFNGTSGYWVGWVQIVVIAGTGGTARNTNPCAAGFTLSNVYYRELYSFGRLCWMSAPTSPSGWFGWQWNEPGLCTS